MEAEGGGWRCGVCGEERRGGEGRTLLMVNVMTLIYYILHYTILCYTTLHYTILYYTTRAYAHRR